MIITDKLADRDAQGWHEGQQDEALHRLMPVQLLTFCVQIPAEIYFLSKSTVTFKVQSNTILHLASLRMCVCIFLCAIELHSCPKTLHMSTHTVVYFILYFIYTVLLPQILARAPNMD